MQSILLACTSAATSKSHRFIAIAYHSHVFLHNLHSHSTIRLKTPSSSKPLPTPSSPTSDSDTDDLPPTDDADEKAAPPAAAPSSTPSTPVISPPSTAPRTRTVLQTLNAQQSVEAVRVLRFSDDGHLLLVAGDAKEAHTFLTSSGLPTLSFPLLKKASAGAFLSPPSPAGLYSILVADKTGDCWQCEAPAAPAALPPSPPSVTLGHLALVTAIHPVSHPPARYLLTTDSDGKLRLSHHPHHYDIAAFCLSPHFISAVAVIPASNIHGPLAVTGGLGGKVTAWDLLTGVRVAEVQAFGEEALFVSALVWDATSECVVAAAYPLGVLAVMGMPELMLREPMAVEAAGEGEQSAEGAVAAMTGDGEGLLWVVTEGLRVHSFSHKTGQWTKDGADVKGLEEAMEAVKGEGRGEGDVPVWSIALTVYHRLREKERRAKESKERVEQQAARKQQQRTSKRQKQ